MPNLQFYACRHCGEEQEILLKNFRVACYPRHDSRKPLATEEMRVWLQKHTQTLCCDGCECCVTLPREIDAETWQERKTQETWEDPFKASLRDRIDAGFEGKTFWDVDIGEIGCPYCGKSLKRVPLFPKCQKCGSDEMDCTGHAIASLKFGVEWPPKPASM